MTILYQQVVICLVGTTGTKDKLRTWSKIS